MGGQHQEDEESGGPEDEQGRRALLLLLKGKLRPFEADAGRQNLMGQLLHPVQRRAGGDAGGRDAHDLGRRVEIEARHAIGGGLVPEPGHRADRHHLARGVAGLEALDIRGVPPEAAVGLGDDLVGPAEIVEVVHILRAQIDLQGVEHIRGREPDLLGLLAIDVGIDGGRAGTEQREDAGEGRILVGGGDQGLRRMGERIRAEPGAVLHHQS